MADRSTSPTTLPTSNEMSNVDLEKGAREPVSDTEAATVVPESDSATAKGDSDGAEEKDPNVVTWDGPDDPMNPKNWTMRKKWINIGVLSFSTFVT